MAVMLAAASGSTTTDAGAPQTNSGKDPAMQLDIAPFASRTVDEEKVTFRWEEPRDIERVVLRFDDGPPTGSVAIAYQQQHWPANRITDADLQKGAGGSLGWRARDDWFNGSWKEARTHVRRKSHQLTVTFAPLGEVEFPDLSDAYNVTFRQTNQLRITLPSGTPTPSQIEVFTGTPLVRREFHVETDCESPGSTLVLPPWDWENTRIEVYNGALEDVRLPSADEPRARLRLLCAQPAPFSADSTIVTLRLTGRGNGKTGFSFRPEDLDAAPHRIWAPDLGILVSPVADNLRFDDGPSTRLLAGKCIYDRIANEPEQSIDRAVREMPPKRPMHFVVGCERRRQKFGVDVNGDLFAYAAFVRIVPGADTPRLRWPGDGMRLKLFLDDMVPAGRSVEAGFLPMLRSRYVLHDLELEEEVCATVLGGIDNPVEGDDPVVALVRLTYHNHGTEPVDLAQRFAIQSKGIPPFRGWGPGSEPPGPLVLDGDRVICPGSPAFTWMVVQDEDSGSVEKSLSLAPDDRSVVYAAMVPPGATRSLVLKVPFLAPTDSKLAQLRTIPFADEWNAVRRYWMNRIDAGAQMQTNIVEVDDFWRSHVTHVLINDEQEPGSDRLIGRVSSINYGNFSNETIMQVMDLDRRGYHDEARRHLETFLHYQGTVGLPGTYKTHDGVFYGSGGYEQGGYNQHHGWVLWGMAEHYRLSGDRDWFLRNADRIAKGCDWVLRERDATKRTDPSGRRVLEYGFMPAGSLEDVTDFHFWLSTNALTCRGVLAAAEALADVGYPDGPRLVREAREFQADLRTGFEEMRVRTPLVRLRDGSFIPDYPSRLYRRGRDFGWIREVLEGSINLIGPILDPNSPEATWVLKDYEDNRYLDGPYNYPLDNFEAEWFSRGGFSFQPNLWYFPPPYLERDQIEHFLRALFNGFAACWRADLRAMTEHPLPGLDGWAGDHFKSSDESMVAFWLRLMFLQESGNDLYVGRGIPRACLVPGKRVFLTRAATHFGPASVEIETTPDGRRMTARIDTPLRRPPDRLFVRFRHPERARMIAASVNGQPTRDFDAAKEWVVIEKPHGDIVIEADFQIRE